MILTKAMIKHLYKDYSNKDTKIVREIKRKKIFRIINGLFETNAYTPGYLLATSIYGPSYISFEYALSYYNLIPEKVTTITCATCDKKKKKEYKTDFGYFTYRDVPITVYPEEIILKEENDYIYQIASPEKALCDKLYTLKPLTNQTNLKNMLFNDLRIDEDEMEKLNIDIIKDLSNLYHSVNVDLFCQYMMKKGKKI